MICEDTLVYLWHYPKTWLAYAGLTSTPLTVTNVVSQWNEDIDSLCSTSGRYVYRDYEDDEDEDDDDDGSRGIVVVGLF